MELIHARKIMNAAKDWAIRNLAESCFESLAKNGRGVNTTYSEKYRAAVFMVEDAITNPTSPTHREAIIWKDLSPVASECLQVRVNLLTLSRNRRRAYLVTTNATRVANTQGGAQSRRVTVRLYPSVAVRVGKNALNEREVMMQVMLNIADKWTRLGNMRNQVLECHVHNPPIRQSIKEDFSLTLGFSLTFIANASVLFHSFLSQSDLDRGQPTVGSGREVGKDKRSDEGDKDRQGPLDVKQPIQVGKYGLSSTEGGRHTISTRRVLEHLPCHQESRRR